MKSQTESPIIEVAARGLAPVIQLIGIYVFFHGHYGPGGGFQGGVLLAAGVLLLRMSIGFDNSQLQLPSRKTILLCAIGALIFAGTGLVALMFGGNFMDYAYLPVPGFEAADLRYYAILFIEVGVTMAVMTALISIYDDLLGS
ncbi:MnhB domain-containing protein [Desulfonatronovibrio hydrogenovorans]|uniref:MnhB domain-containing protein n=1 Tax=Desulfonatronovibrio hydrogenovorans TaxID=53245 RepID=UPI00048E6FF4|nr:MnhB domain-containing protein [Desulfonatronovibrio hydrogenovorans]